MAGEFPVQQIQRHRKNGDRRRRQHATRRAAQSIGGEAAKGGANRAAEIIDRIEQAHTDRPGLGAPDSVPTAMITPGWIEREHTDQERPSNGSTGQRRPGHPDDQRRVADQEDPQPAEPCREAAANMVAGTLPQVAMTSTSQSSQSLARPAKG